MKIPIVKLTAENKLVEKRVFNKFKKAVKDSAFILGPAVAEFEQKFAWYSGAKHAIGVSSGTDALHVALLACGIKEGDEVITTTVTYTSTAMAIAYCGAKPVLVDVDQSGNIDPAQIEAKITPRTKALLIVHLYGNACDLKAIKAIAAKHKLFVIDDCAHSQGARYRGKRIGSLTDISCFSFYPTKNLGAWGDAGAITTNNPTLAGQARLYKGYGEIEKNKSILLGHNKRMDALQAIVLTEKLAYLDRWNSKRRQAAKRYIANLKGVGDLTTLAYSEDCSFYVFPIKTKHRDALREFLGKKGIETIIHYPRPMHLQPCFDYLGYKPGDFPNAERHTSTVLSLPLHSALLVKEQDAVIAAVKEFFS